MPSILAPFRARVVERFAVGIALLGGATWTDAAPAEVSFNRDVRPILTGSCLRCHGGVRELGGVHLGSRDRACMPSKNGALPIVPGDADASELVRRVSATGKERMPPEGDPLTDEQVATLRAWIDEGAQFEPLWSLVPPRDESPPVTDTSWIRSPLDRFVLAGLEQARLRPAPEADRATLLRRVSLDLVGLPPSPEELDRFLSDAGEGAYEREVDRLLASSRFGERWARVWLDLARYADTQGYEKDSRRTIWPFRDWLIDALDRDMPYDEFVVRLLAGDLLPDATVEDRVATAFHRNTLTNDEGGTDDEEFRMAAVFDRVAVTWQAFMGTTFQCVQCHSHPYDPISHREYYEFLAFFNQTEDYDQPDERPTLEVATHVGVEYGPPVVSSVPVMRERPAEQRRTTHLLERGSLTRPADVVSPGTPSMMHAWPEGLSRDRLGLARWIACRENPLFARVAVNRLWQTLFGRGIVETSEDFGSQGTPPTDQPLLDHLAVRYAELGWSTKRLLREIVLSATYRQSAVASAATLAADPGNERWSRAPRYRLEAEAIRDSMLHVAGLLSERRFGPSVMPPQPAAVWEVVYSGDQWHTSEDDDRYRRGIYTFLRRSSPYPSMVAFDAPSRETCTVRRTVSNTPLAALVMMNDPVVIEAARALARRCTIEPTDDRAHIARRLVRTALGREPISAEIERLSQLQSAERERLARDAPAVEALVGCQDVEWAAWTTTASALLSLDEFLSRH